MAPNNNEHRPSIVLASASPRRKSLLKQAGIPFEVYVSGLDESRFPWTEPVDFTRTLARAKAAAVADLFPESWTIGADTIVEADGELLAKPASRNEARDMLTRLSGVVHRVYTGVAVICRSRDHCHTEVAQTDVIFKSLSAVEIEWYIHTEEPYDKAGGYAIQGLGTVLVKEVHGSYTNVVG